MAKVMPPALGIGPLRVQAYVIKEELLEGSVSVPGCYLPQRQRLVAFQDHRGT